MQDWVFGLGFCMLLDANILIPTLKDFQQQRGAPFADMTFLSKHSPVICISKDFSMQHCMLLHEKCQNWPTIFFSSISQFSTFSPFSSLTSIKKCKYSFLCYLHNIYFFHLNRQVFQIQNRNTISFFNSENGQNGQKRA